MIISRQSKPNKEVTKVTTKVCPRCANTNLLLLSTLNKKICTDCDTIIPWYLEDGQRFLLC